MAALSIKVRCRRKRCGRVSPQLDNMLNEQPSPVLLGQRRRIAVSRDRKLGEIDRAEDMFNFDWCHGLLISDDRWASLTSVVRTLMVPLNLLREPENPELCFVRSP